MQGEWDKCNYIPPPSWLLPLVWFILLILSLKIFMYYILDISPIWHLIHFNFVIVQHDNLRALARTFRMLMPNSTTKLFRLQSTILFCPFNWSTRLPRWFSGSKSACQWVQSLGQEDPLEKEMATHSSNLPWEIPWTQDPRGLQSLGSQKSRTWFSD